MAIYQTPGTSITIRDAGIDKEPFFIETSFWNVEGYNDVYDLLDSYFVPPYNAFHPRRQHYQCRGVSVKSTEPLTGGNGGYRVELDFRWVWVSEEEQNNNDREGNPMSPETPPWFYPVEDFVIGTQTVEEAMVRVWTTDGRLVPFENTAGTPLVGTFSKQLPTMSFACNMPLWFPDGIVAYNGKVNEDTVTVCGYTFDPFCLQIAHIESRIIQDRNWGNYKKISIRLLNNPNTFFTWYANLGTEILQKKTIEGKEKSYRVQLWSAVCTKDFQAKEYEGKPEEKAVDYKKDDIIYGSRGFLIEKIREAELDGDTLQAVTEPMFIKLDGTGISPIDELTGRQEPVYRRGCPFTIVPFEPLLLPKFL